MAKKVGEDRRTQRLQAKQEELELERESLMNEGEDGFGDNERKLKRNQRRLDRVNRKLERRGIDVDEEQMTPIAETKEDIVQNNTAQQNNTSPSENNQQIVTPTNPPTNAVVTASVNQTQPTEQQTQVAEQRPIMPQAQPTEQQDISRQITTNSGNVSDDGMSYLDDVYGRGSASHNLHRESIRENGFRENDFEKIRAKIDEGMPLTQLYRREVPKPKAPDYDKKREKWLNINKGIIALSKLAGLAWDVNEFTNGHYITKKTQGKAPIDAIDKEITTLKDKFRKKQEAYLKADELWYKNLMDNARKDREYNVGLQKALAKEYGWDTRYDYTNMTPKQMADALKNKGKNSGTDRTVTLWHKGHKAVYPNKDTYNSAVSRLISFIRNDRALMVDAFLQFAKDYQYELEGVDLTKLQGPDGEVNSEELQKLTGLLQDQTNVRSDFHKYIQDGVKDGTLLGRMEKMNLPDYNRAAEFVMNLPVGTLDGGNPEREYLIGAIRDMLGDMVQRGDMTYEEANINDLISTLSRMESNDDLREIIKIHNAIAERYTGDTKHNWENIRNSPSVASKIREIKNGERGYKGGIVETQPHEYHQEGNYPNGRRNQAQTNSSQSQREEEDEDDVVVE